MKRILSQEKWQPDAIMQHSLEDVLLLNQWTWIWSQPLDLKAGDTRNRKCQATPRECLEMHFSKVIWDLLWINEKEKEKEEHSNIKKPSECHCRGLVWILKGEHKRESDVYISIRHLYERNINLKTILYYKTEQIQKTTHNRWFIHTIGYCEVSTFVTFTRLRSDFHLTVFEVLHVLSVIATVCPHKEAMLPLLVRITPCSFVFKLFYCPRMHLHPIEFKFCPVLENFKIFWEGLLIVFVVIWFVFLK